MAKIYLLPTPIGNLADISQRTIDTLQSIDLLAAEDTRHSGRLLKHLGFKVPMTSLHAHNEHKKVEGLVQRILDEDLTLGVITDAGTPGISDPGYLLIREAIKQDIQLECLPGATAFVPALVCSGLPTDRFCFEGFLPRKNSKLNKLLKLLKEEERTMIFYESPARLLKTLDLFIKNFGADRACAIARELTKIHEEYQRGSLENVYDYYKEKNVKGECIIVLAGR